jgi:hypothetical protein
LDFGFLERLVQGVYGLFDSASDRRVVVLGKVEVSSDVGVDNVDFVGDQVGHLQHRAHAEVSEREVGLVAVELDDPFDGDGPAKALEVADRFFRANFAWP